MDAPTSATATDLWQRLEAYEIGPQAATLTFADRLARENRWTRDRADRVIIEYKRFCYLAMTAGREVTPSDAVDQAWHLHLTYSRDYWERFCPEILGGELHHGPTAGGEVERARYYDQYAETLRAYETAFGDAPPLDIWPSAARRFGIDPRGVRVNPHDVIIVPRRTAFAIAALVVLGSLALGMIVGGRF